MRRAFVLLVIVLVVLAGGVAAAGLFGPNLLKGRVAVVAGRAAHRPVSIGSLAMLPAWPPQMQARDVTVAGVGHIERIDASVTAASVWSGRPRLDTVTLVRPDIVLPSDLRDFAERRLVASRPVVPVSATAPVATASAPRSPAVRQVDIRDGHVVWHDPATGAGIDLLVSGQVASGRAAFSAHGTLALGTGVLPVTGTLTGDPALPPGQPMQVAAQVGSAALTLSATRAEPGAAVLVDVAAKTPDGAAFGAPLGLHLPAGPLAIGGRVTVPPNPRTAAVAIDRLSIESGAGDLSGQLRLVLGTRDSVRGSLASRHLDLDALLAALRAPPHTATAAPASAPAVPVPVAQGRGGPVIPNETLSLPPHLDLDLDLAATELVSRGVALGALAGHLVVTHGRLALDPVQVTPPGGAAAQAALHYGGASAGSTLALRAPSVPLGPLLTLFGLPPVASGNASVDASLASRGDTPRALAADLSGTLGVRMAGGALDAAVLAPLVTRSRLPVALKEGEETLRCLALSVTARDGRADIGTLAIDAGRLAVTGIGTVDLAAETLDLHLRPVARLGPRLSIPLHVAGPWREPEIASDAAHLDEPADPCAASGIAAPKLAKQKPPKAADILRGLFR